jgi:hypothetical protein
VLHEQENTSSLRAEIVVSTPQDHLCCHQVQIVQFTEVVHLDVVF